MAVSWAEPENSREAVNSAGDILVSGAARSAEYDWALAVVNNWRAAHAFPLNTFQMTLRRKAAGVDAGADVAQRTKRLPSIKSKLERFTTMKLSRMQDIAGCRAVVSTCEQVQQLDRAYATSALKHRQTGRKDYISQPKPDGYRGIHLVYRYFSPRTPQYDDLRVEIQLRSRLQHAWATAVETVDIFTKQALKSSRGDATWYRFFTLMGSALALKEASPPIPGTPVETELLVKQLRDYTKRLAVFQRLRMYGATLNLPKTPSAMKDAHFYLLQLDAHAGSLTVWSFSKRQALTAQEQYMMMERDATLRSGIEVVLVSVDSIEKLRATYPNYFLDTQAFLMALEEVTDLSE